MTKKTIAMYGIQKDRGKSNDPTLKERFKMVPAPHTLGHPIITPFEFIIRGSKLDLGACPGKYCALGMLAVPDCLTVCLFGGADGF